MTSQKRISRQIERYVFRESGRRLLLFLLGPRGAGKTTLARGWLKKKGCLPLYFSWDDPGTRKAFFLDPLYFETYARALGLSDAWIVFDEIQKRAEWIRALRTAHEEFAERFRFIVSASADCRTKISSDELAGRFISFHVMPLSVLEVCRVSSDGCFLEETAFVNTLRRFEEGIAEGADPETGDACDSLLRYGAFPEPFFRQSLQFAAKWRLEHFSDVIHNELRDMSRLVKSEKIEQLFFSLGSRVSIPFSMPAVAAELGVAHTSVKHWLGQLRGVFLIFAVSPWSRGVSRALKKESKWYYLDWCCAPEGGPRLENMVACHLYRSCLALTDQCLGNFELHYVRTLDKKELDFLVVRDGRPFLAVDVSPGDGRPSRALRDRRNWLGKSVQTLGIQVVEGRGIVERYPDDTWVVSLDRFLPLLC